MLVLNVSAEKTVLVKVRRSCEKALSEPST